jgi:hypothetical protein
MMIARKASSHFGPAARHGNEDRALTIWQATKAQKEDILKLEAEIIGLLDDVLDEIRPVRTIEQNNEPTKGIWALDSAISRYREELIRYQAALCIGHLHWSGRATEDLFLITHPDQIEVVFKCDRLTPDMLDEIEDITRAYRDPIKGLAEIGEQLNLLGLLELFPVRYDPLFFILTNGIAQRILDAQYRQQTGGRPYESLSTLYRERSPA